MFGLNTWMLLNINSRLESEMMQHFILNFNIFQHFGPSISLKPNPPGQHAHKTVISQARKFTVLWKCQRWTAAPALLHAIHVSVSLPGCFAPLHMFVFHMVGAVHCKSAPLGPPSLILWPCLLEFLWGYTSPISAWTWLQRGLPLCLRTRLLAVANSRKDGIVSGC